MHAGTVSIVAADVNNGSTDVCGLRLDFRQDHILPVLLLEQIPLHLKLLMLMEIVLLRRQL
jgi:hypothetical protein